VNDWFTFASLIVSVVGACVAVWKAGASREAADALRKAAAKRQAARERLADAIEPGQVLLEDIMREKPTDESHYWSRHRAWVESMAAVIADVDRTRLRWWDARIDSNDLEAATRTRVERGLDILERT
jgi:hypothetical protein